MIPCLLAATICFIIAFVAAPPVDIDGIRAGVCSLLWKQHHIGSRRTEQQCHRTTLLPNLGSSTLDEWLYNGGPFQLAFPLPHWHLCLHGTRVGT